VHEIPRREMEAKRLSGRYTRAPAGRALAAGMVPRPGLCGRRLVSGEARAAWARPRSRFKPPRKRTRKRPAVKP